MRKKTNLKGGQELYLDLLKRTLTNTLFAKEPDPETSPAQFWSAFIAHYIQGSAISMLPLSRFDQLQESICSVLTDQIPGDFIETGVWRGGATIFMRAMLKAYDIDDRAVWVADSFEGLPLPDPDKFPAEARAHSGTVMTNVMNHLAVGEEEVRRNFEAFGLLDKQVRFLKGWFKDSLPTAPFGKLAVMRLDGDYYESTMDSLTNLYDKLSIGGYTIIDDYGEDTWTYCRKAVDEFRKSRDIRETLIRVDPSCYYWRRER